MARRKSSPKRTNIEPAVQTLYIPTVPILGSQTMFIDLSQIASLMNRRFYRQGLNWAVAGFKVLSANPFQGSISISKLPNTWVMSNAWEKSFRVWTKMNNEALEETETIRPRFLDFKVYADADHHSAGYASNLLPISQSAVAPTLGDWESSKIVMPNTTTNLPTRNTREIIAVGGSYPGVGASGFDAVSMIEGYASSRHLPEVLDPNVPTDAADTDGLAPENWFSAIFNEGQITDSAIIEDLTTENNQAPYPYENDGVNIDTMYPGGVNQLAGLQIHTAEFFSATTIGGTTRLKGGNFPCGLIRFDIANFAGDDPTLIIEVDLIPGSHRGYLAESMTEM